MTEAQLRAFVAVAEAGGFGEAARRLHMSQPGVSRAIRALEAELGGALFVRTRGAAVLTTLGERALVRSRAVLSETDAMRQERDEARGITSGHVRLGSMPSVSAALLPRLLSRLERRHPALSVTVLATDELLAVVPAGHPLASRAAVRARDLAGEPFILTRAGCERLVLAALAARGVAPNVSHEVSEASSILAMVGEGLGVSVMPGLAVGSPPPSVAALPLAPRAERRLSLAPATGHTPTPAVRAFLAATAEHSAARALPSGGW
jgi:DNA-binding transcriptional LysR family regulator